LAAPTRSVAAQVSTTPTTLAWTVPVTQYDRATLVIQGPGTFRIERSFGEGEPLALDLASLSGKSGAALSYPDGKYKWELRLFADASKSGSGGSEESLAAAERSARFESASTLKVKQWVAAGTFRVNQGSILAIPTPPVRTAKGNSATSPAATGSPVSKKAPGMTPIPEALGSGNFSPDVYIDDSNGGGGDTYLDLYEDNAANYFDLDNFNGQFDIDTYNANLSAAVFPFSIEQNPQDYSLYIANSGAIGVGTSTPGSSTMTLTPTGNSASAELDFADGSHRSQIYENASGFFGIGTVASGDCAICIAPATQVNHTIEISGGDVGIDTLAPNANLDVEGTTPGLFLVNSANSGGNVGVIEGGALQVKRTDGNPGNIRFTAGSGSTKSWLFINNPTTYTMAIRDETGGDVPFVIYGGNTTGTLTVRGGKVGVGTTNPQGKLDVNGPIYQRGSQLHADYVFDPGYKLESIADHAQYMWKHKHLPGIAGMKKDADGREIVNLGAQQRGIVQELEEAHIYIAQLNQKDAKLSKELAATKAELKTERNSVQAELAAQRKEEQKDLSELRQEIRQLEKGPRR